MEMRFAALHESLLAQRVDSLRCQGLDADGGEGTCRECQECIGL